MKNTTTAYILMNIIGLWIFLAMVLEEVVDFSLFWWGALLTAIIFIGYPALRLRSLRAFDKALVQKLKQNSTSVYALNANLGSGLLVTQPGLLTVLMLNESKNKVVECKEFLASEIVINEASPLRLDLEFGEAIQFSSQKNNFQYVAGVMEVDRLYSQNVLSYIQSRIKRGKGNASTLASKISEEITAPEPGTQKPPVSQMIEVTPREPTGEMTIGKYYMLGAKLLVILVFWIAASFLGSLLVTSEGRKQLKSPFVSCSQDMNRVSQVIPVNERITYADGAMDVHNVIYDVPQVSQHPVQSLGWECKNATFIEVTITNTTETQDEDTRAFHHVDLISSSNPHGKSNAGTNQLEQFEYFASERKLKLISTIVDSEEGPATGWLVFSAGKEDSAKTVQLTFSDGMSVPTKLPALELPSR